ncbi:GGDEF domain-containing protein [Aeromicrobium stalagmiti]|uniref:GGDEF domain-containing protein n=1 Tax=Aeromicrobium stalagmiti TaxID=2738988 RepID=UPI0015697EAD|nr:GGDEF domain-containing protein [Aeromicrobium stalagmiti]
MTLTSDVDGPDALAAWHLRGSMHFAGSFVVLLIATGLTETLTYDVGLVLLGVVAATGLAFLALMVVRQLERRWSLLLWPVAVCCGVGALDAVAHAAAGLVMGLVVLSFLFVGLSQPPHWGLPLVVPAAALFVQVMDLEPRQVAVRLPVAAAVWVVCSEVPSRLIMELRQKNAALELLATTDSLTGLLNRTRLDVHLDRVGGTGSVALIDLDHFKEFNDEHGHVAGDVVLMDFATALKNGVRPQDAVFRYGGEEFLVVLASTTPDEAGLVLDRLRAAWSGHGSGLTFSAGVTTGGLSAVRRADALLYEAKADGRDRLVVDTGRAGRIAV